MKNFGSVIVLICFAVLMVNCHKKGKSLRIIPLDSDTFAYKHFNYKPGTYWVYRDSLNGRMDSFYVRNNYSINQAAPNAIYTYHFITLAEVNIDGTNKSDSSNWIINFQGQKVVMDYYYGRNGYGWKNDISFDPLFRYPFTLGDNNSDFDTANVVGVDSFLLLNDSIFYNVATVQQFIHIPQSAAGQGLTYIDDLFQVNDSIGIIKMHLYHPYDSIKHVWELERFKVMKY